MSGGVGSRQRLVHGGERAGEVLEESKERASETNVKGGKNGLGISELPP